MTGKLLRAGQRASFSMRSQHAELAATTPFGGRVVPELGRNDVREGFLRSYRIIYRVAGEDIRISTVFEGHRRLRLDEIEEE